MSLIPRTLKHYHVFIASPGDVPAERQHVRKFFEDYNRSTARVWNVQFDIITWEQDSTSGRGRPQELITRQTLEKYKSSLALVVGIMGQRFGTPSGKEESGTEEEFNWATQSHKETGFPEIKWFFRKTDKLELPTDPDEAERALDQWKKVRAFRQRMQDLNDPVFYTEYPGADGFSKVFDRDLTVWLADPARPWAVDRAAEAAGSGGVAVAVTLPDEFDSEGYREAVLKRFDKLNFEMLDTTGAFYSGVRLWSVFVPQSARECHQYNPRLLEIPKEHQQRLLKAGEISPEEFAENEQQAEQLRREYFNQPLRPIMDVVDEGLQSTSSRATQRVVILGDPGSGKSSLIRYLAVRWASIADRALRDTQPVPLVIDLNGYSRWKCNGRKGFVRFLEEAPVWHEWSSGLLDQLLRQADRAVLLLDGLDEIFDPKTREEVVNDIQRFSSEYAQTPIVVTSRVVGYQPQRLRDAEFRHFMLQDLDGTQIVDFIDRWHEVTFNEAEQATPKRDRLKKAIKDSKSIAMLAGNPLLLTMMAILNRNQELSRDRVGLYEQSSRLLLHQWDTERALADFPGLSAEIGWREKSDMLRRVASFMQSGPSGLKGNMIDGSTLTSLIEDYLHTELHFEHSRAAARAVVEHLRQRNFILCFVGADSYGFVHRTFLEYFCAADFVHQFNIAKTLDEQGLITLFDQHCRDDDWREVLRLICGQIDEQFVGLIVEHLAARNNLEKWVDEPLPEIVLAIQCLGESRNITKLREVGRNFAIVLLRQVQHGGNSQYYYDVVANVKEIGTRWPGIEDTRDQLMKCGHAASTQLSPYYVAAHSWAQLVAHLLEDRQNICELVIDLNGGIRIGALQALTEKWPDETTRTLLTARAVQDQESDVRCTALRLLADKWPDEITRELLTARAVQDQEGTVRSTALWSLAEEWPDETTRTLLTARAVQDQEGIVRNTALQSLADGWPDETTRTLLTTRTIQDQVGDVRSTALQLLADEWSDETTRTLLTTRTMQDQVGDVRSTALQLLANEWSDETTRTLLTARAVQDQGGDVRSNALQLLADKWPDEITRELLTARAVQDQESDVRSTALQSLADKWPDEITRELLTARAVQDQEGDVRSTALLWLADKWPDEITRELLTAHAVQDQESDVRSTALQSLVEEWPDETTHSLLITRAVQDQEGIVRNAALRWLADKWPDETTRELLAKGSREDGEIASIFGGQHSKFGRIVLTRDLDGTGPYLDPRQPISREHIEKAAGKAGIATEQIDETVRSLSQHLGWDITRGSQPQRPPKKPRNKKT